MNKLLIGIISLIVLASISFGIYGLIIIFTPKKPSTSNAKIITDIDRGLYDTTLRCRNKYPNFPYAYGNDKRKMSKGCYTCPNGYRIFPYTDETLDYADTPRCFKYEYKPALQDDNQKNLFSCSKYITENDMPDSWKYNFPLSEYSPLDVIQPNLCAVRKDSKNWIPATYLGKS
jgi:hypothetical protein